MLLVHKRPRKSEPGTPRIYFQFVNQNKSEVIEEDLKAANKVAALLLLHGVQDVVIAPCPHARSAIETAATVLLSSGIRTVVALAYHITEIDAGVFIRSLYIGRHTTPPASFDTSDTDDESKQPSNRTLLEGVYENLRSMDCGDGFLPILLAPFMGVLPTKDLLTISCIWSTRVAKVLGKSAATRLVHTVLDSDSPYGDNTELTEEARVYNETLMNVAEVAEPVEDLALSSASVLLHKDVEFSEPSSPAGNFLTTMCDRVKDRLVDGRMLEEFTEVPESLIPTGQGIMQLNALVPLLLRQHPAYKRNSFSLQSTVNEAFVLYYCYRGKKWLWNCWEDHREWGVVDAEIELEFDNFASACMTGLLHIDLDITYLMGLMRIAAVLEHGAGDKFYYRKTILAQAWTVALAKTLTELRKLQDEGRSRQTDIYVFVDCYVFQL
nr:hypothetical protein FVER53263_12815 [Fusarium verticillioides]